jgi:hypothetical protein
MVIELKGRGFALVAMVLSFIAGNLRRDLSDTERVA